MKKTPRYGKFGIYLVVVVLVNLVAATLFFRLDLTSNKVYSLSKVSREVVGTLKEPLTINVFFTRNLPAPYNSVEQYLRDILGEYALHANTYFNYRFYDVSAEGEIDAAGSGENRKLAGSYGINPVQIQVVEKDEVKFKQAYMGLVIIHGDMVERIPTITSTDGLEYKLTTSIQRLNNKISSLMGLKDKVKVKLFLSSSLMDVAPRMDIKDLPAVADGVKKAVDALNSRMYGKIEYAFVDPRTESEMNELSRDYNLLMLKWPALEEGKIPGGAGVVGLVTEYGDKSFMVPILQAYSIPLFGTQYRLTPIESVQEAVEQSVESLIGINETLGYLDDRGTLALFGPPGSPSSLNNFQKLASRTYSVKDLSLEKGIPEGTSCLLVVRPTEQFTDYDLFQLDQALMRGTNLAIFLDPFMEPQQQGAPMQQGQLVPVDTDMDRLLKHYGVTVNRSLAMDEKCFKQRMPEQYGGGEQALYFAPVIDPSQINDEPLFMRNIRELIAYRVAPLAIDEARIRENKLTSTVLFTTSEAKAALDSFQAQVTQQVRQTGSARVTGLRVADKADVGIIAGGGGSGEEHDLGPRPQRLLGAADKLGANALPLMVAVNRQVGQVGHVAKVGQRPRNSHQPIFLPGGDDQVGVAQHVGHARPVGDGPAHAQRRGVIQLDHGVQVQVIAGAIRHRPLRRGARSQGHHSLPVVSSAVEP